MAARKRWAKPAAGLAITVVLSILLAWPPTVAAGSFEDAQYAIRIKDFAQAAALFRQLAGQGHTEAQYQLAALYRAGRGVPQDHAQAAGWY
ncbi:MAG: sel1 repeat family protein, partial [Gammaproteobacteria bacterium]